MSGYLEDTMLSHTREICGDTLCWKSFALIFTYWECSFEYSSALKIIISKLLTNILVLCKMFCTTTWYKVQLQRGPCCSIFLLHTRTRSFFLQTILEIVFRGKILPTNNVLCWKMIHSSELLSYHSGWGSWYFQLVFLLGFFPFFLLFEPLSFCERNCQSCIKWFLVRLCFSTDRILASESPI